MPTGTPETPLSGLDFWMEFLGIFQWTGNSLRLDLQGLEEGLLGHCATMFLLGIKPMHFLAKEANGHIA